MKKVSGFLVVVLAVVVASGPALATPITLEGVKGAGRVWIWDPKKDDNITAPVTSDLQKGEMRTANWNFGGLKKFEKSGGPLTQVPEPATLLFLGMGLIGVSVYARRRFKTN
jgi:hypothetical protein